MIYYFVFFLTILNLCNLNRNNRFQFELQKKRKHLTINYVSESDSLDFLLQGYVAVVLLLVLQLL